MAAGAPVVPALAGPDYAQSLWHPAQAAQLLGLPVPAGGDPVRTGWDIDAVLAAWIESIEPLPWGLLNESTPSRGRSLRELTVNVFRPIPLLAEAWSEGTFDWDGSADGERVAMLTDAELLVGFAREIQEAWAEFLAVAAGDLAQDLVVRSGKGNLSYRELLDAQRLHAAHHLRQLVTFLEGRGVTPATRLRPDRIPGLRLPAAVF